MSIEWILEDLKKTNPGMTKEKLIEELDKSSTSSSILITICENVKKSACME